MAISEEKKNVIDRYMQIIKNPKSFLAKEGGKYVFAEEFLNEFADAYIRPDFEGFQDEIPRVELKDTADIPEIIGDKSRAHGEYNNKANTVFMYSNRIDDMNGLSDEQIIGRLNMMLGTLCHEYQHGKQRVYVDLVNNGDERAKEFGKQLNANKEGILADYEFNGQECLDVIAGSRPDLYAELQGMVRQSPSSTTKLLSKLQNNPIKEFKDPVLDAFYYRRPIEVDARETSLKIFDKFIKDVLKSGKIKASSNLIKEEATSYIRHLTDMSKQPATITKPLIMNYVAQLTPKDLASFAIDAERPFDSLSESEKSELAGCDFSTLTTEQQEEVKQSHDYKKEEFKVVLEEIKKSMTLEDAIQRLTEIKNQCIAMGATFGVQATNEIIEQLQKSKQPPEVRPIELADYENEGLEITENTEPEVYDETRRREEKEERLLTEKLERGEMQ